ncbi:hypothetical protein [Schleiferia thermophila]|uniref:DUF4834 domain-containing protein n=1 Tax=Schleiferia thermophila TaxID=884107 RepID=A0A369A2R8_9FLAO|nr:hypothetical protein [Schleiferia thermophila]RCX03602.1 hypothetical protein DES35_10251 [Schleiferia thermophila]GCD79837.1 hypothetical protein JCM30197_10840 [Schleiferia thermophila]
MLRFFLILLVVTYLLIVVYKYFVAPFFQGFYGKEPNKTKNATKNDIKVIYNPNDRIRTSNTSGEYIDYEEVKE